MSVARMILSFMNSFLTEQIDEANEEKFTVGLGFYRMDWRGKWGKIYGQTWFFTEQTDKVCEEKFMVPLVFWVSYSSDEAEARDWRDKFEFHSMDTTWLDLVFKITNWSDEAEVKDWSDKLWISFSGHYMVVNALETTGCF